MIMNTVMYKCNVMSVRWGEAVIRLRWNWQSFHWL